MGTRNLTIVYMNGQYKVAQYGQWDGYPEGQGLTCLEFLRDKMDEPKFREQLERITWIHSKDLAKLWDNIIHGKPFANLEESAEFKRRYPEFSRDTGAEILEMIQDDKTTTRMLDNDILFAADSFCEWAWVVDLDKRTFEAYEGFSEKQTTPDDRFYFLRDYEENGYTCVKLVKEWSLDDLPSNAQFLSAFDVETE